MTSQQDWTRPAYRAARANRSGIEALVFTLKHGYEFGQLLRRGHENVQAELTEKILAYNLGQIIQCPGAPGATAPGEITALSCGNSIGFRDRSRGVTRVLGEALFFTAALAQAELHGAWLSNEDERASHALKALDAIEHGVLTFVPAHWSVEAANGLVMAERRKRATQAEITEALSLLLALPVHIDNETTARSSDTAALARQYGLTVYDAAYLELAMCRGSSLATTDLALSKAAKMAGVLLFTL